MSAEKPQEPSPRGLETVVKSTKSGGLPPVDQWNPPFCGDMDLQIKRDGTWIHEGRPIVRKRLVRLFSTILRRDGDDYFLVTPVEKLRITVEDAPFTAGALDTGDGISLTTNVGEVIAIGTDHPLRVEINPDTGEPSPYVLVRRNLEALIDRPSFYQLVDMGEIAPHEGRDWFGLRAGGRFHPFIPASDLGDAL